MSLRETVEKIRSNPTPANEETAKFQILAPILADLSWDTSGPEVLFEHLVGGKKGGGKADIALKAHGRIRALIEAKAPGARLQDHVAQVLGYAFHEGVDICALSDGIRWWLYLPRESGPPPERRFAVLDLGSSGDPLDQVCSDLQTFLGRESLLSGEAVSRAQQVRHAMREAAQLEQEMPAIWAKMLDEPDDELVELLGQRVYDRLSLRPAREQIIAVMGNRPIPHTPVTTEPVKPDPPPHPRTARTSTAPDVTTEPVKPDPPPSASPTAVVLWGERHSIRRFSDILMTIVEELYKRHPDSFEQTVGPLKVSDGKRQYVSLDRLRVAGKSPWQTPSGCFVAWKFNAKIHKKRWGELLEAFGYSESDLQLLYDQIPSEAPGSDRLAGRKPTPRPAAVRLWGERHPVRTHAEILTTVVAEVHRRYPHDFDRAVETLRAGEWQYVSRDPQRVRGTRIRQTPSGHCVDINLSARQVKRRAVELLEVFGHRESDLEYLYE